MDIYLPPWVARCVEALEQAGFAAYAVGGCVRDACLNRVPNDYDLCTQALPEQTQQVFRDRKLVLAGLKHGTVGVITEGGVVEITTFRSEGSYADGRHPDWVRFVDQIDQDLSRRDFTVNAMAWSPSRGLADPFGGREDLQKGILRAVGDPEQRFREDALRILRGLRFAARFHLEIEENTLAAMEKTGPLMDCLARERVFEELNQLLPLAGRDGLIKSASILACAIPEISPMIGFDQRNPHHAYDLYTHTAWVVSQVPADPVLRWAALLHDVGKVATFTLDDQQCGHFYGHDQMGGDMADAILRRLKAPTALREQAVTLIKNHMNPLPDSRKALRRRISRLGWELTEKLWHLQRADLCSKGLCVNQELQRFQRVYQEIEEIRREDSCLSLRDLQVDGNDLKALGLSGKAIGNTLNALFSQVLDEQLPNSREALLEQVKKSLETTQ